MAALNPFQLPNLGEIMGREADRVMEHRELLLLWQALPAAHRAALRGTGLALPRLAARGPAAGAGTSERDAGLVSSPHAVERQAAGRADSGGLHPLRPLPGSAGRGAADRAGLPGVVAAATAGRGRDSGGGAPVSGRSGAGRPTARTVTCEAATTLTGKCRMNRLTSGLHSVAYLPPNAGAKPRNATLKVSGPAIAFVHRNRLVFQHTAGRFGIGAEPTRHCVDEIHPVAR